MHPLASDYKPTGHELAAVKYKSEWLKRNP